MPPSHEVIVDRLDLIESELAKTQSEYPSESALDRLKVVRAMVRGVKNQIELDDEQAVPVLDKELHPSEDYPRG